jgi:hypothetical protein
MEMLSQQSGPIFLIAVGVLMLVYWEQCNRAETPLPLVRHPAGLLRPAFQRLGKNRRLVGALLMLSAVSGVMANGLMARRLSHQLPEGSFADLLHALPSHLANSAANAWQQLSLGLPNWRSPLSGGWIFDVAFSVALAVALTLFWRRRPEWLSPGLHRRVPAVAILAWLAAADMLVNQPLFWRWIIATRNLPMAVGVPWGVMSELIRAPWVALGLSLVWQMAQGRRWSLREAVRDALRYWPAIMVLQAARPLVLLAAYALRSIPVAPILLVYALELAIAAGFLLPWIILGDGLTLGAAVRRQVALWRERRADLGLFLLRYFTLIFLPAMLLNSLTGLFRAVVPSGLLLGPVEMAWQLLQAMITALAWVEFRKLERTAARPAEAAEPTEAVGD